MLPVATQTRFDPIHSILAGLVKFLAVGCGLNEIARCLRQAADTQKRVDCPLIFLIAQGKAKRRPGIRYETVFASPERAEPAARQSMRACFALSGLWRIGAAAYLGRSRTTQGGASLYPGLSHYAPLGRTIRLRIGVQKTRGLSPGFLVIAATARQFQLPIATRNAKDFAFAGVKVVNPFE